jgi:hypothetical protein
VVLYQFINKCHFHANRRWKDNVPQRIKFKKQYKPIGFGDRPSKDTVEGQRNAMADAAETRRYNQMMKELEVKKASQRTLLSRILRVFKLT